MEQKLNPKKPISLINDDSKDYLMSINRNQLIILVMILLAVASVMILFNFGGNPQQGNGKLKVVTSFYPLEYYAQAIGGDKIEASSIIPYNLEVHSWQPSISDIQKAEDANVIIYNGADLDHWVEEDLLTSIETSGKVIVEASKGIVLLESQEHHHNDEEPENVTESDPHLWISPKTAILQAENVAKALKDADPDNSLYYDGRWQTFKKKLEDLDILYSTDLAPYNGSTFFVTHAAFGYIADGYGLEQHGVIGLSADEQPSTATIAAIVQLMIEEGSNAIYIDPVYSDAYANTLKTEIEVQTGEQIMILRLYLILGPIDEQDYLQQMGVNLESLKTGLSG
jgi:zinc transport system substrate-binding protein